jgi:ABC-type sugar transport system ATPase subunit
LSAELNMSAAPDEPGLYKASHVMKNFGSVEVLRGVSLTLRPSRVLTILGENGAGKSTMFKVLAGRMRPTAGTLILNGQELLLSSPQAAHSHGIYLVPQEPALMPELTVAETMFVGQLPTVGRLVKRVDWAKARRRSRAVLDTLELDIDVNQRAKSLSIAQQQQVECAKALLRGCRIILFDEPTSPLTSHEVEKLFLIMRRLQADGCTLSFISHRMDEVMEISDDVAVLRDGRLVDTVERGDLDRVRLLSKMVGREMRVFPRRATTNATAEPILEVRGLAHEPRFRDVSFTLHKGEVIGLAGLVGAGRTEIAETIFGIRAATAGNVSLDGESINRQSSHDLIRKGVVYVPEDRARHGAVLPMTISQNLTSGLLERVRQTAGLLSSSDEAAISAKAVRDFKVRCAGLDQPLRELSGGNQQKVVFGKWIITQPKVAILDEPTRGVDVGAKEEIYDLIEAMSLNGLAILIISSETEELVRLCDRILSVYEGGIVAEMAGAAITPHAVAASYLTKTSREPEPAGRAGARS